jgi:hypothetical protein
VIQNEAVISIVYFEQRGAGQLIAVPVLNEATARYAQMIAGIGNANHSLFGGKRTHPQLQASGARNWVLQFEHGHLFTVWTGDAQHPYRGGQFPFVIKNFDLFPILI